MHRSRRMTALVAAVAGWAAAAGLTGVAGAQRPDDRPQPTLRPPAVPLVASDPYLSVWSMSDRLNGDTTRHWTRRPHPLASLIRIDGKPYRLMGTQPLNVPAFRQTALKVFPTRTIYDFDDGRVHVTLTFMTPSLPDDLDVLARPLTYLTWDVRSVDGVEHEISIYDGTGALLTVNEPDQKVESRRETSGDLTVLRAGTVDQTLLQPAGDDTRIDWGYVYVAASSARAKADDRPGPDTALQLRRAGKLLAAMTSPAANASTAGAMRWRSPSTWARWAPAPVSRHLMIAYDEIYAMKFLGQKLRPFWRRNGDGPAELLQSAERDYAGLVRRCEAFDSDLMADLTRAGGVRYAQIAALAYRQALAGCGLAADANKQPMLFPKENSSNGCVATVDVIYPAAPQFLLMGPTYAKALVAPALIYSTSPRWKFPFAPHDVGTYPQANGQVYGGGEDSKNEADLMPVEESGNLILLCAAIAKMDGNADFASKWWPQLTRWEAYLEKYGEDPENQLCTDDFMGHLAHNANLSVKAILAIAAYGELCRMRGDAASGDEVPRPGPPERPPLDEDGRRRRPLSDRLRPAQHLEPEVQPGLGQAPRPGCLPARGRAAGGRLLQESPPAVRRAARLAHPAHQNGLVPLERDPRERPRRLRGDRLADLRLPQRHHRAAAVRRLVRHRQPPERRHARPPRDRRGVHQDARGPVDLEEVGGPRPVPARRVCPGPDAAEGHRAGPGVPRSVDPLAVHDRPAVGRRLDPTRLRR